MIVKIKWLHNWVIRLVIASITSALLMLTLWATCTVSARPLPSTITVTNTNDSGPGSLRAALATASAGDVAHDDYHLGLGSAATDAGVDVGVTRDFDGDLRPDGSGFDIGFDEQFRNPRFLYLPLIGN